jgi:hypothetical protein
LTALLHRTTWNRCRPRHLFSSPCSGRSPESSMQPDTRLKLPYISNTANVLADCQCRGCRGFQALPHTWYRQLLVYAACQVSPHHRRTFPGGSHGACWSLGTCVDTRCLKVALGRRCAAHCAASFLFGSPSECATNRSAPPIEVRHQSKCATNRQKKRRHPQCRTARAQPSNTWCPRRSPSSNTPHDSLMEMPGGDT